jgi:5-methylcytosine-specific restriction enzyme subunit McrC
MLSIIRGLCRNIVATAHRGPGTCIRFSYVKNKDLEIDGPHKVSGLLLYAKTDEELQPDVVYRMSGNKISIKSLDLNQEFSHIANQLNTVVIEHFGE